MRVRKVDFRDMQRTTGGYSYGEALPERDGSPAPFKAIWVSVKSGDFTHVHRHFEEEIFLIVEGTGLATSGGKEVQVKAGDALYFHPLNNHTILNNGTEDLVFLDIYWENMENVDTQGLEGDREPRTESSKKSSKKVLVFAASPTPNGDLHLGHLSGPYLSADIHTRYRRLAGDDAHLTLGVDSSEIWVKELAQRLEITPLETVDRFGSRIEETLKMARLDLKELYRPFDLPDHKGLVEEIVRDLVDKGVMVAKKAPSLVCTRCDRYIFEVYVAGDCPHCGAGTLGNGCEECALPNDCVDLGNPVCRVCGETPEEQIIERLYFPLEPHREVLTEYLANTEMRGFQRAMCLEALRKPLPDFSCSHVTDWGIPVPLEGFEGQCISSWMELAICYMSGSDEAGRGISGKAGWETFWKAKDGEVVQFYGTDNAWIHCFLYPALYLAFDKKIRPPAAQIGNHFYRLNGEKFSTSRNHAVWGRDLIQATSADEVRFYLARTTPESTQSNFSLEAFEACIREDLIDGCQGWLRDLGSRLAEGFSSEVPEPGEWTSEQVRFLAEMRRLVARAERAYQTESFSLQQAARTISEIVHVAYSFGQSQIAWQGSEETKTHSRSAMALELAAAKALCLVSSPLMPDFAERLWSDLGFPEPLAEQRWEPNLEFLSAGQKISALDSEYFPQPGSIAELKKLEAVPVSA